MAKPAYRAGRDQAATAENVELLTGQRGDKLDKAVTLRDLHALGLASLRQGGGGAYQAGKNPELFPTGVFDKPHAPVNVQASGAFHTVLVDWDGPSYRGHSHTEIWRAEVDNLSLAVLVGTTTANLFSDAIGKGATFYYWARFVNGRNVAGPFSGQSVRAETSRDIQDILDELQGKIESSHLAGELLGPIEMVPGLGLDIDALRPRVDVLDASIGSIQNKIPSIEGELAALDQRQQDSESLLQSAQDQLGNASIDIGLVQDRLNNKIDKYKGDFDSFRDAVFEVDPESGNITMEAVNAVREEMRTSITEVNQELNAVSGQISSKADNVTVDAHGSRITEAEQRINGLDASLSQTVTKGEFTEEQKKVTQIGQELNATKGELAQKATQQEVDEQGERLASAESKLTVHTDELSSQAQRIDGLQATVNRGDEALDAKITELARVTADADGVTAQRVSGLEVRAGDAEGKIRALEEIVEADGGITAGRFDEIQAEIELAKDKADGASDAGQAAIDAALTGDERDRDNRTAFGAIRTQQQVVVNEQAAQAKRITDMNVKFDGKDADTQARITGVEEVVADADSALAQRIDALSASTSGAFGETNAVIKALEKASADADSALAQRITTLDASVKEGDAANAASISSLEKVVVDATQALAQRQDVMESVVALDGNTGIEGALEADGRDRTNREARGAIVAQQETLANAHEALARDVTQLTAAFTDGTADLLAQITEERKVRSDSDRAHATAIGLVEANRKEGDAAISAAVSSVEEALVTEGTSLGRRIDTVIAKAGELDVAVQTQSQAIADLEKGAEAMWTVKAQAGDIKAGIGLVAKSDGTSQVMVSASQFFVFDPNSAAPTAPLFAIDQGKTVIAEALIRKATIQIIHAEKITADYIKAGVSISAPLINGGQLDMGNAFLSGGAAGFGKGGPYGGWGWGWHSIIYSDGSIYTNRLNAEGGYVRNMTIGNCTIEEDCVVKGTIYANKIVGDVFIERVKRIAQTSFARASPPNVNWVTVGTAVISDGDSRDRNVVFEGLIVSGTIGGGSSGALQVRLLLNGAQVDYQSSSGTNTSTNSGMALAVRSTYFHTLPANTVGTYQLQVGGNLSSQYYEANVLSMRIGRQGASLS